jgi:alpha-tubulin suppressor-like RCC1 family protein
MPATQPQLTEGRLNTVWCSSVYDGFSCLVDADNVVWCFGELPKVNIAALFPRVQDTQGDVDISIIASGQRIVICVDSSGNVWEFKPIDSVLIPMKILPIANINQIAMGVGHTLALDDHKCLWVFGANDCGQLGLGDATDRYEPCQLTSIPFCTAIACGAEHSLVIDVQQGLWAFGNNQYGQLGIGNTIDQYNPVLGTSRVCFGGAKDKYKIQTEPEYQPHRNYTAVFAGGYRSIAVEGEPSHTVVVCGLTTDGQLGLEREQKYVAEWVGNRVIPRSFKGVSLGYNHTLVLDSMGHIRAFGGNKYGQLGIDSIKSKCKPVRIGYFRNIRQCIAGHYTSMFIDGAGDLWVFGANDKGQLGLGDTHHRYVPTRNPNIGTNQIKSYHYVPEVVHIIRPRTQELNFIIPDPEELDMFRNRISKQNEARKFLHACLYYPDQPKLLEKLTKSPRISEILQLAVHTKDDIRKNTRVVQYVWIPLIHVITSTFSSSKRPQLAIILIRTITEHESFWDSLELALDVVDNRSTTCLILDSFWEPSCWPEMVLPVCLIMLYAALYSPSPRISSEFRSWLKVAKSTCPNSDLKAMECLKYITNSCKMVVPTAEDADSIFPLNYTKVYHNPELKLTFPQNPKPGNLRITYSCEPHYGNGIQLRNTGSSRLVTFPQYHRHYCYPLYLYKDEPIQEVSTAYDFFVWWRMPNTYEHTEADEDCEEDEDEDVDYEKPIFIATKLVQVHYYEQPTRVKNSGNHKLLISIKLANFGNLTSFCR